MIITSERIAKFYIHFNGGLFPMHREDDRYRFTAIHGAAKAVADTAAKAIAQCAGQVYQMKFIKQRQESQRQKKTVCSSRCQLYTRRPKIR